MIMARLRWVFGLLLLLAVLPLWSQNTNKRLILKDGSYQIVRRYEVQGNIVRYISAERGGEWEELPNELVDWTATERYAREHAPGSAGGSSDALSAAAEIDKEEQQERAEQAARMPEVSPGLELPDLDGVFALDTFRDTPELVEVTQSTGDVNRNLGHNVLRSTINPLASRKLVLRINGAKAKVRLHVQEPKIYVSLQQSDAPDMDSRAFPVDTHGAQLSKDHQSGGSPKSRYAIIRLDKKKDERVMGAVNISLLGKVSQSQDLVDTTVEILPGSFWMKVTPKKPLEMGEYALIEVLSQEEVNLAVWDFGIDPTAPENSNARLPKRPEK